MTEEHNKPPAASASSVILVARGLMEIAGALDEITSVVPDMEARFAARKRLTNLNDRITDLLNRLEKDIE